MLTCSEPLQFSTTKGISGQSSMSNLYWSGSTLLLGLTER